MTVKKQRKRGAWPAEGLTEDDLLRRYGITREKLHDLIRSGRIPAPPMLCGVHPERLCLASPWSGKEPHCSLEPRTDPPGCLFPDIGQA